jgi:hypothetical protein
MAVVTDDYGTADMMLGDCINCGEEDQLVVKYRKDPELPEGIEVHDTRIIAKPDKDGKFGVGVTCGCYARFHRQIAHIEDRMKARKI